MSSPSVSPAAPGASSAEHGAASPPGGFLRASRLISAAGCGVALLTLAGWGLGNAFLTSLFLGYPAMNPLSALCVLALGASLGILGRAHLEARDRWVASALAAVVVGVGALRLFSLLTGFDVPIDLLLFRSRLLASSFSHRMGSYTAGTCMFLGLGLLLLDHRGRRGWRPADALVHGGLAIPLMAIVGYAYAAAPLHGIMAITSASAFLMLSTATLLARPDRGLVRLLRGSSPGGVMTRRVLPGAVVLPLILGWLRLEGQRAGLYGLEIGTALLMLAIVGILVGLVAVTGSGLDAADRERSRAEEALRNSRDRQSKLLEANLIGVITATPDGWITEANPTFLEMIGYERSDLPIRTEVITPPEWLGRNQVALRELDAQGVATPFEKEYVRKDGTRVASLVGAAALPDAGGEILAFVVDLSGKKHAEAEMERMRLFLDSIVENLPNMIFVKDAKELRFVRLNRAGEELLGHPREALLGKCDYDFFPKEEADAFTAHDRAVLANRELFDIPEEPVQTKSGEIRLLHTKKVPIFDKDGTPRYLLGISEDITERRHAEQVVTALNGRLRRRSDELEAANKELEAFSYSVSHDLRAPLRHIDGFSDLLVKHAGSGLDETGRRYLQVISESARNMGQLIDDLLAFSRMGRAEMENAVVDLGSLIAELRPTQDEQANGRTIEWRVAPLPIVRGDAGMLRLVFTNLLSNAVKYSSRASQTVIEIGAQEAESEVVIYVRDNGVGFDMKYAHKLFGVFQRLHSDNEFEGTGVGLANVRRIVHRHGGRTWAEGTVDAGATFYVALPNDPETLAMDEAA